MSISTRLDDSPIESEALSQAQNVPSTLIAASAGDQEDVLRASGLILTKEQLINVKRYESRGLSLPVERKDVINYLGYERGAGPNLEATDFQNSFALIRNHAARWNPIRTELMNVSSELWVFADRMLVYERGVQEIIDRMSGEPQGGVDPEDKADLLYCINQVLDLVRQRQNATTALKVKLDDFAVVLSREVMPVIEFKLDSIRDKIPPGKTDSLIADIGNRSTRLNEIQREYTTLVTASLSSGAESLDLRIYTDAQVDRLRRQIRQVREEQQLSILKLMRKSWIHGTLHRIRDDLQDMKLVVLDADIATKNLVIVWNNLHTYLSESAREGDRINDSLTLRRLMNGFRLVANPWGGIKLNTDRLLRVFKEADSEFRRDYGHG
jgi:uncharacterized protein Smg (DUF494 family)